MASSQEMMRRKREARVKAKGFALPVVQNTTTWVDERYGSKLANQLYSTIQAEGALGILSLSLPAFRRKISYLTEEILSQSQTRVWYLDVSRARPGFLMLSSLVFTNNRVTTKSLMAQPDRSVYLSPHSQVRLYERLRTNSLSDFKEFVTSLGFLSKVPQVPLGTEAEVKVPGGKFYLVRDKLAEGAQDIWVLKTFIADKK